MKQKKSLKVSKVLVKEIFSNQSRYFKVNNEPKTVGEYYKKYLKNA